MSKKFFSAKGPGKPVYKHSWNRDDDEESPAEPMAEGDARTSQSQTTTRISPEKRKQPTLSQERRIFKSKISRTVVSRKESEERILEEESCTQIRCTKEEKGYYTVVKNVKDARQCLEWGETQEIIADIDYLLGAVVDSANQRIKCLSVINIATKCQSAQFRAHLRSHGSSVKLFAALTDAPKTPSLAICTACVIYLLARDRLGITVDQRTLELIIELVNLPVNDGLVIDSKTLAPVDPSEKEEYDNYRQRVWKILNEWRQQSEAAAVALNQQSSQSISNSQSSSQRSNESTDSVPTTMMFDITLENLSARFLALEALTFICVRTHDDSFRKWMRESRGLHYIAQYLVKEADATLALNPGMTDYAITATEHVKMLERYLRIMEHASLMNQQNQAYLVVWESSSLVYTCARLFKHFKSLFDKAAVDDEFEMDEFKTNYLSSKSVLTVLTAALKTLLNLSHSNVLCCGKLGDYDRFIGDCVDFVTSTIPEHVHPSARYDMLVLSLGLLVNLVEACNANRKLAIAYVGSRGQNTLTAFTKIFLDHDAAAQATDDEVEKVFEGSQEMVDRNGRNPSDANVQETVNAALKKASKHMEESIVASHFALFLGLVLQQNEGEVDQITAIMPNGKVAPLIAMLQKFLDFMLLTNAVGRTGEKTIGKAIEIFEHLSE